MEEIRAQMSTIEEPRHPSYVKYALEDILIIIMCGVLCGLDTLGDLVVYAKSKADFQRETFGIEKIPSKATLGRILSMVDGKQNGDVILDVLRERFGTMGEVIAVDGKAICSTARGENSHKALQILSAYVTGSGITLAQETIHEKTNEIPVFQEMLTYLDIESKVVTADAMHCQRETSRRIVQKKGDYLFGLKENQPSLLADVRLFLKITSIAISGRAAKRQNKTQGGLKRGSAVKQPIFPGWRSTNGPDCEVYLRLSGSRRTTDITEKKQAITFPAGTLALGC